MERMARKTRAPPLTVSRPLARANSTGAGTAAGADPGAAGR